MKKIMKVLQYPLGYKHYKQCLHARFVGGTSKYLCECDDPEKCEGWQAAKADGMEPYALQAKIGVRK